MAYPDELDTLQTVSAESERVLHALNHNTANRAVEALQAKVGVGDSTPAEEYFLVGTGTGTSEWKNATQAGGTMFSAGLDDILYANGMTRKATVTLSSADILDLHNTPVTLVAAPGAGKVLVPHRVVSFMPTCTPYASTSTAYPILRYAGISQPNTELTEDVSYGTPVTWSAAVGNISLDTGAATDVALVATTDGAQFTDGDGTLTVTVWYSVEDVPA